MKNGNRRGVEALDWDSPKPHKAKLTDELIAGLKPPAKREYIWDTEEKRGFALVVSPKGKKTFVVKCYVNISDDDGKPTGSRKERQYKLWKWEPSQGRGEFRGSRDARGAAADLIGTLPTSPLHVQGVDPRAVIRKEAKKRDEGITIGELVTKYWERHLSKLRSGRATRQLLETHFLGRHKWCPRCNHEWTLEEVAQLLEPDPKTGKIANSCPGGCGFRKSRNARKPLGCAFGEDAKAVDVTHEQALALFDEVTGRSKRTANKIRSLGLRIYDWGRSNESRDKTPGASDKKALLPREVPNPFRHIERAKWKSSSGRLGIRDRYLTSGDEGDELPEIKEFWDKLPTAKLLGPDLVDVFRLMLITGKRPGEVCGMSWKDIKKDTSWWTIPAEKSKNRQEHGAALTSLAREILDRRRENRSPDNNYVFASESHRGHTLTDSLSTAIGRNLEHFGQWAIDRPFTPHDLRRTVGAHLLNLNVPGAVIDRVLGHIMVLGPQGETGKIYTPHELKEKVRKAMEKWDKTLRGLIGKKAVKDV